MEFQDFCLELVLFIMIIIIGADFQPQKSNVPLMYNVQHCAIYRIVLKF